MAVRRGSLLRLASAGIRPRSERAETLRRAVARVDPPDRERLESRLDRAAKACGCSTGSAALLPAVVGVVAWWLFGLGARIVLWPEGALAALVVVGAAFVGKVAGLAAADVWLWWVGRRFRRA